jgi:hypothetical protein
MRGTQYKAVFEYKRLQYPCGLEAGDKLRVTSEIIVCDHRNRPTGYVHQVGEVWEVLPGVEDELNVIWLRDPSGEEQTWDDTILDTFQKIEQK